MQLRPSLFVVLVALVAACGGGSSERPPVVVDSPGGGDDIDAPGGGGEKNIGDTCTPDQANPQGDCPSGFVCLGLEGGTNPWCSKLCTPGAGDQCAVGYTGTGLAACFLQVTPPGGGAAQTFCGVVCDDQTDGDTICPAAQCDGTCPGTLACNGALMNQGGMTVALGCL
jgi:hypothetical protein